MFIEQLEEDEEPYYMIDIYFKILALFLAKIEAGYGQEKMQYYFENFKLDKTVGLLRPHVMDDTLFSDIKKEYKVSDKILSLLDPQ